MADTLRIELLELLRKSEAEPGTDFLRDGVKALAQALMEAEVEGLVGAGRHERTGERKGYRNGHRERDWDTRVGTVELWVPRVREGGYVPALLEPRKRAERALCAVVQQAYVHGVSTRKVDDLVKGLGMEGISKSQVSRICAELDAEVERFTSRPLTGAYPYVWLDATFLKVRRDGRVVSVAVVIAIGVRDTGEREVLGFDVGPSEDGAFWLGFLRGLVARGLSGVQLVTSDSHEGLKGAIQAVLQGASWQRCRVHWMRNALSYVSKAEQQLVAATIRTVFAQPTPELVREHWGKVAETFRVRYPRLAQLMDESEEDVLAYTHFPHEHWRQIWSNNPLERLNKEIKRRTDVVGIFPNDAAIIRLVGMILSEQHDEWQVSRKYFSAESLAKLGNPERGEGQLALAAVS
jgi:transposase-like protein